MAAYAPLSLAWKLASITGLDTEMKRQQERSADSLITEFDRMLRTVASVAHAVRPRPDAQLGEAELSATEREHAAGLMRVNHVGEVCAQALYQGQAFTARDPGMRESLRQAAGEEEDHLAWCAGRIEELGGRLSMLNPLWYGGALAMGIAAGTMGDRWNLAFLAETERQVEVHLAGHLQQLSPADARTRAVVEQMRVEEGAHRTTAVALGAAGMPGPLKSVMRLAAKIMTTVAYRI